MSLLVHARRADGGMRFRLWATGLDDYVTGELSEEEALRRNVTVEISDFLRIADEQQERINRAAETGTSGLHAERELDGPWDEGSGEYATQLEKGFEKPPLPDEACRQIFESYQRFCDEVRAIRSAHSTSR